MTARAALGLITATIVAVGVGAYAGSTVPIQQQPITVPSSGQVPDYEDERWQDPSGYPYCTYPDDGLRPCIDAQTGVVSP